MKEDFLNSLKKREFLCLPEEPGLGNLMQEVLPDGMAARPDACCSEAAGCEAKAGRQAYVFGPGGMIGSRGTRNRRKGETVRCASQFLPSRLLCRDDRVAS